MVKKLSIILLVVFAFFCISKTTYAISSNNLIYVADECGVLGNVEDEDAIAYYLQGAFDLMRFAAVILFVVFTIKDLVTAIPSGKTEDLQKLGKKTLKRFIYAVLLFFLPSFINLVADVLGLYGTCGIN